MNHGWQSEATDGPRAAKRKESAKRKKSADRSGKYFSTPETWTVECNCRRIFANIWFSQVWKHSSYTYAIPWCFKIWAWLRHEFLETAIPWWFTSKFWPRHELGMSLSFDCTYARSRDGFQKACPGKKSSRYWSEQVDIGGSLHLGGFGWIWSIWSGEPTGLLHFPARLGFSSWNSSQRTEVAWNIWKAVKPFLTRILKS